MLLVFSGSHLNGQACCSGGVPTSSNLGMEPADGGLFILSLGADLNFLSTLKSGSTRLDDELRDRSTQSYLFRAAYSFSASTSVEVLLPYVRQTRTIVTNAGVDDNQNTRGVGDMSLLATYKWLDKNVSLRTGIGLSLPTGDFDQSDDRGLFLLEDLQPGSGALDIIFYNSIGFHLSKTRPTSLAFFRTIYALNGVNKESRNGAQTYQFGDDLQLILGYTDQYLLGSQLVSPDLGVRYRSVQRDLVDGIPNSGSGGDFIFLRYGLNWTISPDYSFYFGGELPIYGQVNETQLAPTYSLNIGFTATINTLQNNEIIIIN